jgi:hypothetical protein
VAIDKDSAATTIAAHQTQLSLTTDFIFKASLRVCC